MLKVPCVILRAGCGSVPSSPASPSEVCHWRKACMRLDNWLSKPWFWQRMWSHRDRVSVQHALKCKKCWGMRWVVMLSLRYLWIVIRIHHCRAIEQFFHFTSSMTDIENGVTIDYVINVPLRIVSIPIRGLNWEKSLMKWDQISIDQQPTILHLADFDIFSGSPVS